MKILTFKNNPLTIPEDKHGQFRSLDGARFVASVGIVMFHYCLYLETTFNHIFLMTRHFYMFVDIFFVISGAIISMMYADKIQSAGSDLPPIF